MITRLARVAGVTGVAVLATAAVTPAPASAHPNANAYIEHKLVSDLKSQHADITDSSLQNPWGLAQAPQGTPAWVANNGTNVATLYQGAAGAPGPFA